MPAGLTQKEAQDKLKQYGKNEIQDFSKVTPLGILLRQVKSNHIVYLLTFAAVISFYVGKTFTGYTIFAVIFMVIAVGFIQEYKAEQSIESLKKMIIPIAIVYRDGKKVEVPSSDIVPGDLLVLGNGEKIPADCEILESYDLRVNEASLTGESKEISKKVEIQDGDEKSVNKIYMGTFIVNGRCLARITHTGMNTKFGKIAHLISTAEKELPLQKKVNDIVKYMVFIAIIMSTSTGALLLYRADSIDSIVLVEILILTVAIAVSAFPEGMPVVLITTLAVGAKRMLAQNALVNRMSIIETLGETTIICSDKTGTITRGEMTVKFMFTGNNLYEVEGSGYVAHGNILKDGIAININENNDIKALIEAGVLCTDAEIERTGNDNEYRGMGSPTEIALLVLGAKQSIFKETYSLNRINEKPFSSERKMMSVLLQNDEQTSETVYAKGAPEVILSKCSKIRKNGEISNLSQKDKELIERMQSEMSDNSYRTLVVACRDNLQIHSGYEEEGLVFLGLVAMEDPPREEVVESIKIANEAGIRVVMITGDNKNTAVSIAKQIGLNTNVLVGYQIDELSDDELKIQLESVNIFARVKPEHKIRIVKLLKEMDEIVAMTGDGVNDAPALKEAHIGIAMGKNGTDVSRSAADLILKDDNFATIVTAIAEGRTVFNNLRKFITYQLSCNMAEITLLFFGVLLAPRFGWQIPLLVSIQILFMNLVTDNLPAITLGLNPTSKDIMKEKPRKNENILNKVLIKIIVVTGLTMMLLTMSSYAISFHWMENSLEMSRTTALVTLILLEIGFAFSFRSFRKKALTRSPFVNKYLVYASIVSLALTIGIIYTPLNRAFETIPIDADHWLLGAGLMLIGMVIMDIFKSANLKNPKYISSTK